MESGVWTSNSAAFIKRPYVRSRDTLANASVTHHVRNFLITSPPQSSPSSPFTPRANMLEAKLAEAQTLKKLLEGMYFNSSAPRSILFTTTAIKELVTDANFQCGEEGIVRVPHGFYFQRSDIHRSSRF